MLTRRPGSAARIASPDGGFALAVALTLVLIVFILISAVLSQVSFDFQQTGRMERRIKAINAAEAGLAWYMRQIDTPRGTVRALTSRPWTALSRSHFTVTNPTGTALNGATFGLEIWYLASDPCAAVAAGSAVNCSLAGTSPFNLQYSPEPLPEPLYALIRATGTAGETTRTLESALRLHAIPGAGLPNTVVASGMCLGSGANVTFSGDVAFSGDSSFPAGYGCSGTDIVVNGYQFELASGELLIKNGGFIADAPGTRVELHGLLWADGAVRLGTNAVDVADEALPDTSCGGRIKICAWSDVFAPSIAKGRNAAIMGTQSLSEGSPPLSGVFPTLTWAPSEWASKGWNVVDNVVWTDDHSVDWAATKTVYHVTGGACPFVVDENFSLPSRIAVVSDVCGFSIQGAVGFNGVGGVSLIVLGGGACSAAGGNNITLSNGPTFGSRPAFFYTPCVLTLENNASGNGIFGQLYGRFLSFKNRNLVTFLNASPDSLPGPAVGFTVDVRYVREVTA